MVCGCTARCSLDGHDLLTALLLTSVILLTAFVVAPLAWFAPASVRRSDPAGMIVYCGCLGSGFMLIEIGLMQRFVLLLGHPVYSLTVILFTLLLGGGIGSAFSRRLIGASGLRGGLAIAAVMVAALTYAAFLPQLIDASIALRREVRIATASLLSLPLGVLMGVPLPAGITFLGSRGAAFVAWAWANGMTSVLGAALAVSTWRSTGASRA
jgi:hypothetical protein